MSRNPSSKALSQPFLQFADVGHQFVKIRIVPVHHRVAHLDVVLLPFVDDSLRWHDAYLCGAKCGVVKPLQAYELSSVFNNVSK